MSNKSTQLAAIFGTVLSLMPYSSAIAQNMTGECRALNRTAFLYTTRSRESPVLSLTENSRVTLEEESKGDGWIAVSTLAGDNLGFVETRYLMPCNNTANTNPPSTTTNRPPKLIEPSITTNQNPSVCRRVIYRDPEGVAIRTAPRADATWLGSLGFDDVVMIDRSQTRRVGEREWVKLTRPVEGWMSNGFPGEGSNLGVCL